MISPKNGSIGNSPGKEFTGLDTRQQLGKYKGFAGERAKNMQHGIVKQERAHAVLTADDGTGRERARRKTLHE